MNTYLVIISFLYIICMVLVVSAVNYKDARSQVEKFEKAIQKDDKLAVSEFINLLKWLDNKSVNFAVQNYAPHLQPLSKDEKIQLGRVLSKKLGISRKQSDILTNFIRKNIEEVTSDIPSDKKSVIPNPSFVAGKSQYVYDYCRRNTPLFPRLNPDPTNINIPWRGFQCGEINQRQPPNAALPDAIWEMSRFSTQDRARIEMIPDIQSYLQIRPSFSESSKSFVCNYLDPQFGYGGYDDYCFSTPFEKTVTHSLDLAVRDCRELNLGGAIVLSFVGSVFLVLPSIIFKMFAFNANRLTGNFLLNLFAGGVIGQSIYFYVKSSSPDCDSADGWGWKCGALYVGAASVIDVARYLSVNGCSRIRNSAQCLINSFFKPSCQLNNLNNIHI